ncbi:MAG: helix-turn-helix domain-containing protein, partial [Anaerolineales bacterium]
MPKINPDILVWARETAGLTQERAAEKLGIHEARGKAPVERLSDLELEAAEPTRAMLVKMAKQYRRPLLVFYLEEPPKKGDRGEDFRTLPEDYSVADNALLEVLARDVVARQDMVRALLEAEDEAEFLDFVGSAKISDGVDDVLASIRNTLKFNIQDFYEADDPIGAFALLRSVAEQAGVF